MELVKFMADALDGGDGEFFGFQFKRKYGCYYLLCLPISCMQLGIAAYESPNVPLFFCTSQFLL